MGFVIRIAKAVGWIWACAFIFCFWMLLYCSAARPAETPRSVALERMTIPHGWKCDRCEQIKATMSQRKVKTVKACEVGTNPPQSFPLCVYSDGSRDYGDLVLTGRAGFAGKVYVITWMEKEKR